MVQVPSWLAAAYRGHTTPVPDAAIDFPDRTSRSVGWRWIGMFYSAIPDPEIPVDRAVLRAVRSLDPELCPLVVKWVFQRAEDDAGAHEIVTFKRHGVARRVTFPKTEKMLFQVDMPVGAKFPVPNQIDRILEANHNPYTFTTRRYDSTLPGAYLPFSWDLFYNPWVQLTPAELKKRYVDGPRERRERFMKNRAEENARKKKDLDLYVQKQLDKLSDVELALLARRRRAGLPLVERPTRSTFVLKGTPQWQR